MRSTILSAVAIILSSLLICPDAAAQGPRRPRLSPGERAAELKKVLNLTDEQTSNVQIIYEQQEKELRELFESASGDRTAMREAMQQKLRETDEKIMALLDRKQKERYKQWTEERRARFEQRRQRRD